MIKYPALSEANTLVSMVAIEKHLIGLHISDESQKEPRIMVRAQIVCIELNSFFILMVMPHVASSVMIRSRVLLGRRLHIQVAGGQPSRCSDYRRL